MWTGCSVAFSRKVFLFGVVFLFLMVIVNFASATAMDASSEFSSSNTSLPSSFIRVVHGSCIGILAPQCKPGDGDDNIPCLRVNETTCIHDFLTPLPFTIHKETEGVCVGGNLRFLKSGGGRKGDTPPNWVKDDSASNTADNGGSVGSVPNFKRATSWLFQRWFNWNESWVIPKKAAASDEGESDASMHATHDENLLYQIKNFCVKPMGRLRGYNPTIYPYHGEDEVIATAIEPWTTQFRSWLRNVEPLSKPPEKFLNQKVIILPIQNRMDNVFHVFNRAGNILRLMEAAFGDAETKDVLILYVVLPEGREFVNSHVARTSRNALKMFYQMLGPEHMSVWGYHENIHVLNETFRGNLPPTPRIFDRHICFRRGFAWMNCHNNILVKKPDGYCSLGAQAIPGAQVAFHMHGDKTKRDQETLDMLTQRLGRCTNIIKRRETNPKNPRILIVTRSKTRRIFHYGSLLLKAKEYLESQGATVETFEHPNYALHDVLKHYQSADGVLGVYGAGLGWGGAYLPPGGILMEINYLLKRFSTDYGINQNVWSEYGGYSYAGQLHYGTFDVDDRLLRESYGQWQRDRIPDYCDIFMPEEVWVEILRVMLCVIRLPKKTSTMSSSPSSRNSSDTKIQYEEDWEGAWGLRKLLSPKDHQHLAAADENNDDDGDDTKLWKGSPNYIRLLMEKSNIDPSGDKKNMRGRVRSTCSFNETLITSAVEAFLEDKNGMQLRYFATLLNIFDVLPFDAFLSNAVELAKEFEKIRKKRLPVGQGKWEPVQILEISPVCGPLNLTDHGYYALMHYYVSSDISPFVVNVFNDSCLPPSFPQEDDRSSSKLAANNNLSRKNKNSKEKNVAQQQRDLLRKLHSPSYDSSSLFFQKNSLNVHENNMMTSETLRDQLQSSTIISPSQEEEVTKMKIRKNNNNSIFIFHNLFVFEKIVESWWNWVSVNTLCVIMTGKDGNNAGVKGGKSCESIRRIISFPSFSSVGHEDWEADLTCLQGIVLLKKREKRTL